MTPGITPEPLVSVEAPPGHDRARLWESHRTGLRAYLLAAVRDLHDAEDLLQDVSIVVLRRFEEFQPGTSFGAWAREIARRCLLDRSKKLKRRLRTLDPGVLSALECAAEQAQADGRVDRLRDALRLCLERVGSSRRRVVDWRYGQGLSVERIAGLLDKTIQAVYATLKRTKEWLRRCSQRRLQEKTR